MSSSSKKFSEMEIAFHNFCSNNGGYVSGKSGNIFEGFISNGPNNLEKSLEEWCKARNGEMVHKRYPECVMGVYQIQAMCRCMNKADIPKIPSDVVWRFTNRTNSLTYLYHYYGSTEYPPILPYIVDPNLTGIK